jgi:hypothetical protein
MDNNKEINKRDKLREKRRRNKANRRARME